jgi:YfiR/HmsC-like
MCSGEGVPGCFRPPATAGRGPRRVRSGLIGLVALALSHGWIWGGEPAQAEDLMVPARVQAPLIGKVVGFDRNFVARVKDNVTIAVVSKASNTDSERAATQMLGALGELGRISGLSHDELPVRWTDANSLAAACAERNVAIVYLTPGFEKEVVAIVKALDASRVLTVAGALSYVKEGVILGFDLVSGRPKLVINLASARRNGIAFHSSLLAITRVVQ